MKSKRMCLQFEKISSEKGFSVRLFQALSLSLILSLAAALLTSTAGCALFKRSPSSGYAGDGSVTYRSGATGRLDREGRRTAYELGLDPNTELSGAEYERIMQRMKVREMERTLSSRKEKEQYSKVLPWLGGDSEKIEFLQIPTIEGRQAWINNKNIWNRAKAPTAEMTDLIETQDIAIGMPQDYVRRSWGDPASVEVSGNPIYKNERWKYQRYVSGSAGYRKENRIVYFEGGRVVGWETE